MNKLLLLVLLSSCSSELPQAQRMFEGEYDIVNNITITDQYGTIQGEGVPSYWSFEKDSIRVFTKIDDEYININGRALPASFTSDGKPQTVGCRVVVSLTDTSITWVQQEGSVDFPWVITKVLKKR